MIYLVIIGALFCLTLKGYCGKKLSSSVRTPADNYLFNLLRMVFCLIIGIALVFLEKAGGYLAIEGRMIAICALAGISNSAFLVCWMLAIRRNPMVSVDVSLTLGSLIPSILCLILFAEPLSLPKMIGFTMIVIATLILAGNNKGVQKSGPLGFLFVFLAAVGDGMSGFAQQLYKQYYTEAGSLAKIYYPKTVYHFYTYLFSAVSLLAVLVIYYAVMKKKSAHEVQNSSAPSSALTPRVIIHIFIMAVCLFAANYLQTVATNDYGMSSQMLYPIIKGGCLITVNFVAMIFFGERITRRSILGSLAALAGIICMSIL